MAVYIIIFAIAIFLLFIGLRSISKRKNTMKERQLANHLENISKEIKIARPDLTKSILQVDEPNKKFSVDYEVLNFKDLMDFDYKLDGDTIVSGRGLQTVAGGFAFGLLGAAAGASGKRKQKEVIKKATLILRMDNLENPTINISVNPGIAKSKIMEDVISTLQYIKLHAEK